MKFMLMGHENAWERLEPAERERRLALHRQASQELVADRELAEYSAEKGLVRAETFSFAGVRLMPSAEATTHRVERGRHMTSDGPFAETKELVGGFQIFDCDSRAEAVKWAKQLAIRDGDLMEIRPVESLWWVYHG